MKPMGNWTSVSQVMPKPEEDVWAVIFDYGEGGFIHMIKAYCDHDGEWYDDDGRALVGTIIYWQYIGDETEPSGLPPIPNVDWL